MRKDELKEMIPTFIYFVTIVYGFFYIFACLPCFVMGLAEKRFKSREEVLLVISPVHQFLCILKCIIKQFLWLKKLPVTDYDEKQEKKVLRRNW